MKRSGTSRRVALAVALACAAIPAAASRVLSADPEAQEESGPRADVAFAWGLKAFNHGDDKEAVARFEEAVRLDPDHGTASYWLGLARLRSGDAQGAAQAIEKSLAARRPPTTPKGVVLTSLGEAQLRSGDAAAAEKTLAQALTDRPNDPNVLYLHGLALARLGEVEKGRADAERALALEPTLPKVPSEAIAPGTGGELVGTGTLPFFEIRVEATGGHDSNPGTLSDDVTPTDPLTLLETERSDTVATAAVRAELHPFYGKGGWSLGLLLNAYRSFHQDLDALDLGFGDAAFQLAWGKDPLGFVTGPLGYTRVPTGNSTVSFLIQGGVGYSHLDGESYNRIQRLAASVTIREGASTATQIDADYQDLNYFQSGSVLLGAENLNGHLVTLKASQYFFLGRRDRYIRAGILRGEDSRSYEYFDSTITEGSLEVSLPLSRWLVFYLAGSYREDDRDSGPLPHKEKTPAATAAFIVPFAPHFYLTARGSWIDHDVQDIPDENLLDYDRTVASLGVTWYY